MKSSKLERLSKMLRQVGAQPDDLAASSGILESATSMSEGTMLDIRRVESVPGQAEIAAESLDFLLKGRTDDIDADRQDALEAIVMPYYRPVVDIAGGQMVTTQLGSKWRHLGSNQTRSIIESTFKSIGRIEIPHHPILPYAGTGFVVGKHPDGRGILMTNRHVAEIFSAGIGIQDLQFRSGQTVSIDFLREYGRDDTSDTLAVEKVLMVHPYWDMALLQVVGLSEAREALKLSVVDPATLRNREVVTVGYPGYDPTGGFSYQNLQNRIFRGVYYVKRLQPGVLKIREEIKSYTEVVQAITHDCSTLGGNSGSAVLVLPQSLNEPITVVGLHFAGAYLHANYAVPAYDLATDSRVVDTGIKFFGQLPPGNDIYRFCWSRLSSH